jgi:ketosteroid isomerase-like protein
MSPPRHPDPRVHDAIAFFERLTPADLPRLGALYAANAQFKDPFNEVVGVPAIQAIFAHMFDTLDGPRFVVTQAVCEGDQAFLVWDFHFHFKSGGAQQTIRGSSHLRFDDAHRITLHRDYWDAAEELYEKLPVLGALMRWVKRRASQ